MKAPAICLIALCILMPLYGYSDVTPSTRHSMLDGLGRGFANVLCAVIEVPRSMTYYAIEYPVLGIAPGAIQGVGMTVYRTVGGIVDIVTLGSLAPGYTVYDIIEEPLLPWQSPWIPPDDSYQWPPAETTVPASSY